MSQFRNLVFEGGGVKGIAYVGAMQVLAQEKILSDIVRVGGTSAGAINAVLFACKYSNAEQKKILADMDFNKFMDDSFGVARDIDRLVTEFGWHKGEYFRNWIFDLIANKLGTGNATFRDFEVQGKPALFLYGTNLSTGFGEVFSVEHTPTMRVVDAVRISMSIPLFFSAIRQARGDVYVDGGLLNNYPIRLFDREKYLDNHAAQATPKHYHDENKKFLKGVNKGRSPYVFNKETLGFRLDNKREIAAFRYGDVAVRHQIDDLFDYSKALVSTLIDAQEAKHLQTDDWHRTVYIDTLGVGTTEFDIDQKTKTALVKSGQNMTRDYLAWFKKAGANSAKPAKNSM